jgi:cystathionine beta-lyase/cystathionine gamma-synthase
MSERDTTHDDGPSTRAIHAGKAANTTSAVTAPIWQTTTFKAASPGELSETARSFAPSEFYTRYGNPTNREVELTLASLENGESAMITASGMGAIFATIFGQVRSGDHIVAQRTLYDGTGRLLADIAPRFGVTTTFFDGSDLSQLEAAIRPETKLVMVETPSNPLLEITDLKRVAAIAKARGLTSICDNTFATPILQKPLDLGVDIVVHSATKYLGGHSDVSAGAIVASRAKLEPIWRFSVISGATLGPFDAWLLLRGLRTLSLRVEQHGRNALALARALEASPHVARVHYPGLESHPHFALCKAQMKGATGMLSFEHAGGYEAATRFVTSLRLGTHAVSLGGHETLVVHPAAMWGLGPEERSKRGISDALVRVSVGLEDAIDLVRDFEAGLAKSA